MRGALVYGSHAVAISAAAAAPPAPHFDALRIAHLFLKASLHGEHTHGHRRGRDARAGALPLELRGVVPAVLSLGAPPDVPQVVAAEGDAHTQDDQHDQKHNNRAQVVAHAHGAVLYMRRRGGGVPVGGARHGRPDAALAVEVARARKVVAENRAVPACGGVARLQLRAGGGHAAVARADCFNRAEMCGVLCMVWLDI